MFRTVFLWIASRWLVVVVTVTCLSTGATLVAVDQEPPSTQESQHAAGNDGQAQEPAGESEATDERDDDAKAPTEEEDEVDVDDDPASKTADGDEAKAAADDDSSEKENKITISGYFAAENQETIALNTKQWTAFRVVEFVQHGSEVRKGEALIEFETTELDQAIADQEAEIETSAITLDLAERQLELLRKTTPIRMTALERDERLATENLKQFLTVKRNSMRESAERGVKTATDRLMYEEEELEQLEKMYNSDDLTEETEEIILLRTRNSVDSARYYLERAKESREDSMKFSLPRREEDLENALLQATLALEEAQLTMPTRLETDELKLAKQRMGHQRLVEKLQRLKSDRELMTITAPVSGTVYYGRATHGKWTDPAALNAIFRPGGVAKRNQTLMTVVKTAPLQITAALKENELQYLIVGTTGTVQATANPDAEFSATISSVSKIPAGDKFPTTLEIDELPDNLNLVPGMTCKIEFPKPEAEEDGEQKQGDPEESGSEKGDPEKGDSEKGDSEKGDPEKGDPDDR